MEGRCVKCSEMSVTKCACGVFLHASCAAFRLPTTKSTILVCRACHVGGTTPAASKETTQVNSCAVQSETQQQACHLTSQTPSSSLQLATKTRAITQDTLPYAPATVSASCEPDMSTSPAPSTRSSSSASLTPSTPTTAANTSAKRRNITWRGKERHLISVVHQLIGAAKLPPTIYKSPDSDAWTKVGHLLRAKWSLDGFTEDVLGRKAGRQFKGIIQMYKRACVAHSELNRSGVGEIVGDTNVEKMSNVSDIEQRPNKEALLKGAEALDILGDEAMRQLDQITEGAVPSGKHYRIGGVAGGRRSPRVAQRRAHPVSRRMPRKPKRPDEKTALLRTMIQQSRMEMRFFEAYATKVFGLVHDGSATSLSPTSTTSAATEDANPAVSTRNNVDLTLAEGRNGTSEDDTTGCDNDDDYFVDDVLEDVDGVGDDDDSHLD